MKTIDMTPKWVGVVRIYMAVLENPKASAEGRRAAHEELLRMADAADKYNDIVRGKRETSDKAK